LRDEEFLVGRRFHDPGIVRHTKTRMFPYGTAGVGLYGTDSDSELLERHAGDG